MSELNIVSDSDSEATAIVQYSIIAHAVNCNKSNCIINIKAKVIDWHYGRSESSFYRHECTTKCRIHDNFFLLPWDVSRLTTKLCNSFYEQ